MKKRLLLVTALLSIGVIALSACGGGESDESKIENVIEEAVVSEDPSRCTELETQGFVEQSTGLDGSDAVDACEKEAKEDAEGSDSDKAEEAKVENVEVEGDEANAEVEIVGSAFGGQTLGVLAQKEDDDWKVAEITEFKKLDQPALVKAFVEQFEGEEGVTPEIASCVGEGLEAASKADLEEFFLENEPKPLEELAEGCAS